MNAFAGKKEHGEIMAKHGLMYSFVGNTCPKVHVDGGSILVGHYGFDDQDRETPLPGRCVGDIITDLWAVCATDLERFVRRVEALELGSLRGMLGAWDRPALGAVRRFPEEVPCATFAVRVPLGRYRVAHHYDVVDPYDRSEPRIYVRLDHVAG